MFISGTSRDLPLDELGIMLRKTLRDAVHSFGLDRFTSELNERTGRSYQSTLINAWMSETKHRWRLPAELVPIVCEILGDDTIQRLLLSEKLQRSLELGESTPKVVALLRDALSDAGHNEKPQRRSKQ